MACNKENVLYTALGALLDTLANVASQIAVLDKQVRTLAQKRKLRIPTQSGQGFRFDVGHRSDLIPATIPK